jgi:hypothetical protein
MVQVTVLLDQTGSMLTRKAETILSFNQYIADLVSQNLEAEFSLTLFNSDKVEVRHSKANLSDVVPLADSTYSPASATPLLDAIMTSIKNLGDAKDCFFVIITDGEENASKLCTKAEVKQLIEEREGRGWVFTFLGIGGMDSVSEAGSLGIAMGATISSAPTDSISRGTMAMATMTSTYVTAPGNYRNAVPSAQAVYDATEDEKKGTQKLP